MNIEEALAFAPSSAQFGIVFKFISRIISLSLDDTKLDFAAIKTNTVTETHDK